jgi:hypothetical protein
MLRCIHSIPGFLRPFIIKWCWIYWLFLHLLRWSRVSVFASVYVLHYIFWFANVEPPCASLRWSQLDHDEWLFCYFIFDFPLFYWGHLHQCPLRRLACRSFWSIVAFIVMKCLSLSCLTNIILKSTLPDVNIATLAYLGGPWVS